MENHLHLPPIAGIGLRACHYQEVALTKPAAGWLEIHPENFFAAGGIALHILENVALHYPLSFHGVGLSLGSVEPPSTAHLHRLKRLVDCFKPAMISEHIAWSASGGIFAHDLLPLPYTEEAAAIISDNIMATQDFLGRRILVENPSSYLSFTHSTLPEWEFINIVAERSGCGILLDINNLYVTAHNHGLDAIHYLHEIDFSKIGELHLAGHRTEEIDGQTLLIDHHGSPVSPPVWALYRHALERAGRALPTLIEWDTDIPPLSTLLAEAKKANEYMEAVAAVAEIR